MLHLGEATAPKVLRLLVHGEPIAKGRPRIVKPKGRDRVMAFTPQSTVAHMDLIRRRYLDEHADGKMFEADVALVALFSFTISRPKSAPRKRRWPVVRPDLTNYAQLVCDALTGFAYHDDSQLVEIHLEKQYGVAPSTLVTIFPKDT